MLRLGTDLSQIFTRRTLRVLYGQTQAYPYSANLDTAFDQTQGALSGGNAITGAKAAIFPGLVAIKKTADTVTLSGAGASTRPLGLFADYVGGTLGTNFPSGWTNIGVWRGPGSVYELLAPSFDTTGLSALAAAEDGTSANEVYLKSNAKGQLVGAAGAEAIANAGRLHNYLSANAIIVELLV